MALLFCPDRKTCTNLAKSIHRSHDSMYRGLNNPIERAEQVRSCIIGLNQRELTGGQMRVIFDDTMNCKHFAIYIDGLAMGFDGSIDLVL